MNVAGAIYVVVMGALMLVLYTVTGVRAYRYGLREGFARTVDDMKRPIQRVFDGPTQSRAVHADPARIAALERELGIDARIAPPDPGEGTERG